jgi:hypothetical protein
MTEDERDRLLVRRSDAITVMRIQRLIEQDKQLAALETQSIAACQGAARLAGEPTHPGDNRVSLCRDGAATIESMQCYCRGSNQAVAAIDFQSSFAGRKPG